MTGRKMPLKGALDIVRIDHKEKTIRIIDFKSSYSASDFVTSIKKFGYCDQLSFYDYLLRSWISEDLKEYDILPPINIVIDIADRVPYIYEYQWKDILLAKEGNAQYLYELFQSYDHNQKIKRGWINILEDICWHYENNLWDKTRELYENKKIIVKL